jgi:hypothetical protein
MNGSMRTSACVILGLGLTAAVGCDIFDSSDSSSSSCGVYPDSATSSYVLPFPAAARYRVLQGNCGNPTHKDLLKFAYDFKIPTGDVVAAARDGAVSLVVQSWPDGDNVLEHANHIFVRHSDGTVARYLHLKKNGALVEVGDIVTAGEPIALSGSSGMVITPHLHFDVCETSTPICRTMPVTFRNAMPQSEALTQGLLYTALP